MMTVDRELDRVLTLLRNKIREQGFTQLEVQEALGWGRSYISQLLTKQKSLRIEQVLLILNVIDVDASRFFDELYRFESLDSGASHRFRDLGDSRWSQRDEQNHSATQDANFENSFEELRDLLRGLLDLLTRKGILRADEIGAAATPKASRARH